DRSTGKVLVAKPFVKTSWAREIRSDGRPILLNEKGTTDCLPDQIGATNLMPASFDPALKLFFVTARESCAIWTYWKVDFVKGQGYRGGGSERRGPIYSVFRAIDPSTGERRWEFPYTLQYERDPISHVANMAGGVMSTASGLV